MHRYRCSIIVCMALVVAVLSWGAGSVGAEDTPIGWGKGNIYGKMRSTTMEQRRAAAANFEAARKAALDEERISLLAPSPGSTPDYFGPYPNYANSPLPAGPIRLGNMTVVNGGSGYSASPTVTITDRYGAGSGAAATANVVGGVITTIAVTNGGSGYLAPVVDITDATGTGAIATAVLDVTRLVAGTGMRKFRDALPALVFAVPDTITYPGSDYYEISVQEYTMSMHSDIPNTRQRGYRQTNNGTDGSGHNTVAPPAISYLGPVILAQRDRPVRVKFTNNLPKGAGGNLFIPVDTSYMGAGTGPNGGAELYTQNRVSTHLHGGTTPWISDGTPHQWITPAGEVTSYPKGVSVENVPDMPDPGNGSVTFFYSNQQSARLMFYHEHAFGITRLGVYAGLAAGYLLTDTTEQTLINGGVITYTDAQGNSRSVTVSAGTFPDIGIPLVIQDRSFVPSKKQLDAQDPTWNLGTLPTTQKNGTGDLWYPHVYMTNQNPWDPTGANAMGRWDYGPWFWPPFTALQHGPVANPYYDPVNAPWEPPFIPGVHNVSGVPESFMDTPTVNGKAYPTYTVDPKPYRFKILNAANDKYWNLSLWVAADKNHPTTAGTTGAVLCTDNSAVDPQNCTECKMVPFNDAQNKITPFPEWWYTYIPNGFTFDDRQGGVPDPTTRGPAMIQVGTEGGVLPGPALIRNQPVNYVYNRRDIVVGNVLEKALFIGPAERADIIVDFTNFAGMTLILYNDAPTPVPAPDPRLDYYTGDPDQSDTGGAPTTLPGYGPNTRTVMKIVVTTNGSVSKTRPPDDYNPATLAKLQTALPAAFAASQDPIIVPEAAYNDVYNGNFPNVYVNIQDTALTFTPLRKTTPITMDFYPKSIIEDFQMDYGRMNATLGLEVPHTNVTNQTSVIQAFQDPPSEVIKVTDPSLTPIGTAADGTQLWKITHNGVDTHAIHFHMFNLQIINRVGWDGAKRPPDPNELGFKETIRMNPLEDIVVALRPITLTNLPFKVPNSIRPLAPHLPLHSTVGFTNVDPQGNPINPPITNEMTNFGWEYVWHCHLLGHEENDMMRPMALAVAPETPSGLTAVPNGPNAMVVSWTDNSMNATGFTLQRADNSCFSTGHKTWTLGYVTTYTDTTVIPGKQYYYRVLASDTVGSTVTGYPQVTADSQWFPNSPPFPPLPCPDCSGGVVVLKNMTFPGNNTCECVGTTSITIGPSVTVETCADVTFKAPKVDIQPGFHAETGAVVHIKK